MSLVSKLLPYAIKGVSKVAPALATGAETALGDLGIKKKLFGKGITIPKTFSLCYLLLLKNSPKHK